MINSTKFKESFLKEINNKKQDIYNIAKETIRELGYRLVERTPVGNPNLWRDSYWPKGYTPGHMAHNWQMSFNSEVSGEIEGEDSSGKSSRSRIDQYLNTINFSGTHYLVNNVEYSEIIEDGHWSSQQAPYGIVSVTQAEFSGIFQNVILRYGK